MSSWRDNNEDDGLDDEVFDESDEFNDGLDDYVVSLGLQQRLQLIWLVKASDEFEYYRSAQTSHKIHGSTFVPYKKRTRGIHIICSLSTNALERVSLVKKTNS